MTIASSDDKNFYRFYFMDRGNDIFGNLDAFSAYIEEARADGEYAYRRTILAGTGPRVQVPDPATGTPRSMILMASNNYLDLAMEPRVIEAAGQALRSFGYGSGSVSLLAGTHHIHRELEDTIARFYAREDAVVFPSGYAANVGTISSLSREEDLLLLDMYSHASIVDGTRLCNATVKFFKHNDMDHLRRLLDRIRPHYKGVLIATDGVFSMDGDVCDLPNLVRIKREYDARLMIDEAHAVGILGPRGRGTEDHFDLEGEVDILAGTLSKAPAGLGGYVAGSRKLSEFLRHFSNSYVFSTSLPPPVVGGLVEVFRILTSDHSRMKRLHANTEYFISAVRKVGFNTGPTITAIVPVILGDEKITRLMAKDLDRDGIFVSPVVFPAVRKTQARLRFSLMSGHTREELEFVVSRLEEHGRKYGILS